MSVPDTNTLMPVNHLAQLLILLLTALIPPVVLASPTNDADKLTLLESEFTRDGTVNLTKFDKLLKGRSPSQITRIFSKPDLIAVKGLNCPIFKANHEYWYYKSGGGNLVSIAFLNNKCVSAKVTNAYEARGIEQTIIDSTVNACKNKSITQIKRLLGTAYTLEPYNSSPSAQVADIESYSFYCGDFLLVFDFTKGICTNIKRMMEFH